MHVLTRFCVLSSRKYYYVQISTGHSTWELPTSADPAGAGSGQPGAAGAPDGYSQDRAGGLGVSGTRIPIPDER